MGSLVSQACYVFFLSFGKSIRIIHYYTQGGRVTIREWMEIQCKDKAFSCQIQILKDVKLLNYTKRVPFFYSFVFRWLSSLAFFR